MKAEAETERSAGSDQMCTLESADPVMIYNELGETAMQVTG